MTPERKKKMLAALRRALARLRQGWVRKTYYYDGGFCLLGACQVPDDPTQPVGPLTPLTPGILGALGFRKRTAVMNWNDATGRTQREVVQRVREAIAKVKAA
jgi:hypothetical protein